MEQIKKDVLNLIKKVVKELYEEEVTFSFETPKHKGQGDFSCNISMHLARVAKKAPRQIAEEIVNKIDKQVKSIDKIEIAGPGFINFFVSPIAVSAIIKEVLRASSDYGKSEYGNGVKVNLEFVSANPTGDLHLGHTRGAAAGDSIARIFKAAGYDITKEFYFNDGGNQIYNLGLSVIARYKQLFNIEANVPEDGYHSEDIIDIAKEIMDNVGDKYLDEDGYEYFKQYAVGYYMKKIVNDLKMFRVEFDVFTNEQDIRKSGEIEHILSVLKSQGDIYESEGATWLKTEKYGDDKNRVLIKTDNTYTYLVPDIAYHINKYERGYDVLIDLLGGDHHGYIRRLKAAMEALKKNPETLNVEILQMVRLVQNGEEVKMSKRSGKSYKLRDFIEEIGVDATRYFFVMRSLDTHMDFDLDLALSKTNENPVYYAQYAHARMVSILNNADKKSISYKEKEIYSTLTHEKELDLLKLISDFKNVIIDAAVKRAPHKITNYIQNLASAFHSFYNAVIVITEDVEKTEEKLALIKACQVTIKNALELVGVSAPNNM